MHRLRHSALYRLLASLVMAGMALWASAPLAAAHPQAAAAQTARAYAAGPLELAVAEALAAASRSDDASGTFAATLAASLAAHPEGQALADLLDEGAVPADLLDLLIGQLLRGTVNVTPLIVAAAPAQVAPPAIAGSGVAGGELDGRRHTDAGSAALAAAGGVPVSIWELSAAQPLGP